MSAGQLYQAQFQYVSTAEGVLSFSPGQQFTLLSQMDANWWKVRSASGETGLAPISYLESCPVGDVACTLCLSNFMSCICTADPSQYWAGCIH